MKKKFPKWLMILIGLTIWVIILDGYFLKNKKIEAFGVTIGEDNTPNLSEEGVGWGVVDIGKTRIQWGRFKTRDDNSKWTEIIFPKEFKNKNIALSVSTSETPEHRYPIHTREITERGFEALYGSEEADPVYSKMRGGISKEEYNDTSMGPIGSKYLSKQQQSVWLFGLYGIECNYMAIGWKPD